MAHVTIGGRELFHQRRGTGEPLLLIQGMSGTHLTWGEPFLAELAPVFDIVSYDHRGIGRSGPVHEPFMIAELAEDALALMDAAGFQTAHVLGISMGGMVAQELALRNPDRVRTLALGCTYCGGPGSSLTSGEVANRIGGALSSGDRELAIRTLYEVNVSAGFAADPAAYEPFREMAKALPAPIPVVAMQMQAIGQHDTSSLLPELQVPTLVIHGDEDLMLPVENGRMIASLIPGARLEVLEGIGHAFWWEQPHRSAELVREHALSSAAA
jgi:pimeloyl-ACP methyl ester carboxylesterase